MTDIRIVRQYPHPPAKLWRALTDPELIALWGMRSEGFSTVVGTHFKFFGTPNRAWRGFIECELLEAREPSLLRYSWIGNDGDTPTTVGWTLAPRPGGTQLSFEHLGFKGMGGFFLAHLVMKPGHLKKLDRALPALLATLDSAA
jgi:uncharacterized protein YndB with AHSA1/START domain